MNPNMTSLPNSTSDAANAASKAIHASGDKLRDAKDTTLELARDLTKKAEGYSVVVRDWVKENPLQAALIGAGLGFAAGAVARRAFSTKARH